MRTYSLRNVEYPDFESFIAAKRDLEKIESLDMDGESLEANADSLLLQIKERKLSSD